MSFTILPEARPPARIRIEAEMRKLYIRPQGAVKNGDTVFYHAGDDMLFGYDETVPPHGRYVLLGADGLPILNG
jgi:hypothetical protein